MTIAGHIGPAGSAPGRPDLEPVPGFEALGVIAFTTTRARGDFALDSREPARDVFGRWQGLMDMLSPHATRLAFARQVHGDRVLLHEGGWSGWMRATDADAHVTLAPATALAVTVADCVPVFLAHPTGAVAVVHSGWRGTVAKVASRAVQRLVEAGAPAHELHAHCGPSICGGCYEVSSEVYAELTGRAVAAPTPVDLRALIADDLRAAGVRDISISPWCTRCDNTRFYSHRCGDAGRQVGVIARI
ncbi:MAG: polyphenol oxidase family protein [Gemmatimonadaceae bacterium]|nr:polyphenol oxidase family protein [Gemmatimonadaceae bacterium]